MNRESKLRALAVSRRPQDGAWYEWVFVYDLVRELEELLQFPDLAFHCHDWWDEEAQLRKAIHRLRLYRKWIDQGLFPGSIREDGRVRIPWSLFREPFEYLMPFDPDFQGIRSDKELFDLVEREYGVEPPRETTTSPEAIDFILRHWASGMYRQ